MSVSLVPFLTHNLAEPLNGPVGIVLSTLKYEYIMLDIVSPDSNLSHMHIEAIVEKIQCLLNTCMKILTLKIDKEELLKN